MIICGSMTVARGLKTMPSSEPSIKVVTRLICVTVCALTLASGLDAAPADSIKLDPSGSIAAEWRKLRSLGDAISWGTVTERNEALTELTRQRATK